MQFPFISGESGAVAAHDQHSARALHPGGARRHAAVPAADDHLQGSAMAAGLQSAALVIQF